MIREFTVFLIGLGFGAMLGYLLPAAGYGFRQVREVRAQIRAMKHDLENVMTKISELPARFQALADHITKTAAETKDLIAKYAAAREALVDVDLPPEAEAALAAVEQQETVVDSLIDDLPSTEPPVEEPPVEEPPVA